MLSSRLRCWRWGRWRARGGKLARLVAIDLRAALAPWHPLAAPSSVRSAGVVLGVDYPYPVARLGGTRDGAPHATPSAPGAAAADTAITPTVARLERWLEHERASPGGLLGPPSG